MIDCLICAIVLSAVWMVCASEYVPAILLFLSLVAVFATLFLAVELLWLAALGVAIAWAFLILVDL